MLPSPPLATVLLDPPTALLVGSALAVISTHSLLRAPGEEVPRTIQLATGWSAWYAITVGYFFFAQPDWMMAYLKDAREVSLVPAYLGFLLITAAFGGFGSAASAYLIANGRRRWAWALTAGAALTVGGVFWLQWSQYLVVGTYAEYRTGTALPLPSHEKMKTAMNFATIAAAVPGVAIVFLRLKAARAARRA